MKYTSKYKAQPARRQFLNRAQNMKKNGLRYILLVAARKKNETNKRRAAFDQNRKKTPKKDECGLYRRKQTKQRRNKKTKKTKTKTNRLPLRRKIAQQDE